MPVVAADDPEHLLGLFRREDAVRAYHLALGAGVEAQMGRDRLRARMDPGAEFFFFEIPQGSVADGRSLQEVAWPDGSTLVSIRRGRQVMVPTGTTVLEAGDVVTAFGTPGAEKRLRLRLDPERTFEDDDAGA